MRLKLRYPEPKRTNLSSFVQTDSKIEDNGDVNRRMDGNDRLIMCSNLHMCKNA